MMVEHLAEEIPVDAYSSYIMQLSEARTGELRREAAEYAMSRIARRQRVSLWTRTSDRLLRRRTPALEPAGTIPLPARTVESEPAVELRRSA